MDNKKINKKPLKTTDDTEFADDQLGENASGIDSENEQYKNEHNKNSKRK